MSHQRETWRGYVQSFLLDCDEEAAARDLAAMALRRDHGRALAKGRDLRPYEEAITRALAGFGWRRAGGDFWTLGGLTLQTDHAYAAATRAHMREVSVLDVARGRAPGENAARVFRSASLRWFRRAAHRARLDLASALCALRAAR